MAISKDDILEAVGQMSVMDLNDNPPMFINQPYYAVISKEAARDSQGMEPLETISFCSKSWE